jgi:hypothetical protein
LRALWRAADRLVIDDDADAMEGEQTQRGLAVLLGKHLSGPEAEWDRSTLLEASGAQAAWLNCFLGNQLDLTDLRDVGDLARVLHTLDVQWDEAEGAVQSALWRSPGGIREAQGPMIPMAARGKPGASDDEVTESLYADQSTIDTSEAARKKQVAGYLVELRRALEDLE